MVDDVSGNLADWILSLAQKLEEEQNPSVEGYVSFLRQPALLTELVDLIEKLPDNVEESTHFYQSACVLAFDICVAQLQSAKEHQNKYAQKLLIELMDYLAKVMSASSHTFGFWLPILNAFYETRVELAATLQEAFMGLAGREEARTWDDDPDDLQSIRDILVDLSDLSDFDIAEHLFSQGHAMPPEFYMDLLLDLYSVEEGQDIGVLFLLHPNVEVRQVVFATLDHLMSKLQLSDLSLTRLKMIQNWYPESFDVYFKRWIKLQRRLGATFLPPSEPKAVEFYATEVDGAGSQGIMMHIRQKKHHKVCGLLYKQDVGIKDVWVLTMTSTVAVNKYYRDVFDDRVTLRTVDLNYVKLMTNHFLALLRDKQDTPPLYFLEVQMLLGEGFYPELIDPSGMIQELGVPISPFTPEVVAAGLKRTHRWMTDKSCAQSWFEEDAQIDACVNQCCNFVDGIKECSLERANELVMSSILENRREKWGFHFLWIALWAKARTRKHERFWQDAFFVAYTIFEGEPLQDIPIMRDICELTTMHSLETMHERRSHLNLKSDLH
ncbi:MAG: hypothetical protein NTW08_04655 [Gammaproteobacteria bacterium]|nr:hypothetical protein [Gammaproteobacteria bacterium]